MKISIIDNSIERYYSIFSIEKNRMIYTKRFFMADIIYVDDDNFEKEVLKSNIPVLVDFWAEWCAPCRMIGPMIEDIAKEYNGKATVAKFDVDKGPKVPSQYAVTNLPTLILFNNGQPMDKLIGAVPKSKIKGIIDSAL